MSETILKTTQFVGVDSTRGSIKTISSLSSFPYTATEDCWCCFYFYKSTASPANIRIDDRQVLTFIGGYHSPIVPLKKGQTITLTAADSFYACYVFGVLR